MAAKFRKYLVMAKAPTHSRTITSSISHTLSEPKYTRSQRSFGAGMFATWRSDVANIFMLHWPAHSQLQTRVVFEVNPKVDGQLNACFCWTLKGPQTGTMVQDSWWNDIPIPPLSGHCNWTGVSGQSALVSGVFVQPVPEWQLVAAGC